jgi:hypothetical protein
MTKQGVCHTLCGLAIYIIEEEQLRKFKYFTFQKYTLQKKIPKIKKIKKTTPSTVANSPLIFLLFSKIMLKFSKIISSKSKKYCERY